MSPGIQYYCSDNTENCWKWVVVGIDQGCCSQVAGKPLHRNQAFCLLSVRRCGYPSTSDVVSLNGLPCLLKTRSGKNKGDKTAQFHMRFLCWPAASQACILYSKLPVIWKTTARQILSLPGILQSERDFTATIKFLSVFFYLHCFKDIWAWHLLQDLGKSLQLQNLTGKKKKKKTHHHGLNPGSL